MEPYYADNGEVNYSFYKPFLTFNGVVTSDAFEQNIDLDFDNFKVVKEKDNVSLVSCILETGRTHQIRVHLSSINHPLCGDGLYGGSKRKISRVGLHSYRIKLINPITFENVEVIQALPLDMKKVIGE